MSLAELDLVRRGASDPYPCTSPTTAITKSMKRAETCALSSPSHNSGKYSFLILYAKWFRQRSPLRSSRLRGSIATGLQALDGAQAQARGRGGYGLQRTSAPQVMGRPWLLDECLMTNTVGIEVRDVGLGVAVPLERSDLFGAASPGQGAEHLEAARSYGRRGLSVSCHTI